MEVFSRHHRLFVVAKIISTLLKRNRLDEFLLLLKKQVRGQVLVLPVGVLSNRYL